MSAHWAMLMVPTSIAASINPWTVEAIGPRRSIWDPRSVFQILRCAPATLRFYLPAHGIRGVRLGAPTLPSMAPGAVFTVRKMQAKHGRSLAAVGYLTGIGDAWVSP